MALSECLYEVLGVNRDSTTDHIRSAYKRLALQRHPDKLLQAGVPEAEATAAFQELVHAYEILIDAHKRAVYDSHRSPIISSSMSGPTYSSSSDSLPNLSSFYSKSVYSGYSDKEKGFYKVYGDLFERVYMNELNSARKLGLKLPKKAPRMGNLDSPYAQVTAFYNYWSEFVTVMDFCWDDQQKDYNETVQALAKLVERRDKRVIDMQKKRDEEKKRRKEKERLRKDKLEKLKVEKAKIYIELEIDEDERADDDFYPNFEEDESKFEE